MEVTLRCSEERTVGCADWLDVSVREREGPGWWPAGRLRQVGAGGSDVLRFGQVKCQDLWCLHKETLCTECQGQKRETTWMATHPGGFLSVPLRSP